MVQKNRQWEARCELAPSLHDLSLLSSSGAYSYAHIYSYIAIRFTMAHCMTFDRQPSPYVFAHICIPSLSMLHRRPSRLAILTRLCRCPRRFVMASGGTITTTSAQWRRHVTRYHGDFTHARKSPPVSSYVGSSTDQTEKIYSGSDTRESKRKREKKGGGKIRFGLHAGLDIYLIEPWERESFFYLLSYMFNNSLETSRISIYLGSRWSGYRVVSVMTNWNLRNRILLDEYG